MIICYYKYQKVELYILYEIEPNRYEMEENFLDENRYATLLG